jgi:hypothetical protein
MDLGARSRLQANLRASDHACEFEKAGMRSHADPRKLAEGLATTPPKAMRRRDVASILAKEEAARRLFVGQIQSRVA